jgi:hypothetical protein
MWLIPDIAAAFAAIWFTIRCTRELSVYVLSHVMTDPAPLMSSATTLGSVWNTRVFRTALMALTESRTLWRRITRIPSRQRWVALHTHLHYYAPGIRTIRTTHVLHSSQGLQLCCSCSHNSWRCICLSSADSHILPLRYCCISDAALTPYMFSFEILSHIAIQSSLRMPRLPLHLLRHYRILQVWNIQSNLHTL